MERETLNIYNAIWHFTVFNIPDIPDEFFKKILQVINPQIISDREYFQNPKIAEFIDHNKLNKAQIIRFSIRNPEILNKINLNNFQFKIRELEHFLKAWPDLMWVFNLKLDSLSSGELFIVLSVDRENAHKINFKNIDFDKHDLTSLIQNYYSNDVIMHKILEIKEQLDHFHIRTVLLQTGSKYIDQLDLFKLKEMDWYTIVQNRSELFSKCNMEIFEKNECYYLIKLAKHIPEVEPYVFKNKDKISGLGWEKLLILDFDKYSPYCNWEKLSNTSKKKLLELYPKKIKNF